MNIKGLLLGTAAAFAVVSGAQAADAIVAAAPEPMEYVKVCDAFGTGYFYIPGTETCLKINGSVRWQLNYSNNPALLTTQAAGTPTNAGYHWSSNTGSYGRIEVNAKNSTEVGTVYSFIRITGNSGSVAGSGVSTGTTYNGFTTAFYAGVDAGAFGFEVGNFDTYLHRNIVAGGLTDDGGNHKGITTSYAAVYGKSGALTYSAGVDDWSNVAGKTAGLNAGVRYGNIDKDPFSGAIAVNYDIAAKAFGAKGYVQAIFNPVTLRLIGVYSASANSQYAPAQGFSMVAGGKVNLTSQIFAAVDYSYSFTPKTWNVVGDLGWNVANGFAVLAEGKYTSTKTSSGFLRFERSF
ncbi:hypothetical protein ABID16_001516 [Rhizobium aquaticum]|uniref:Porin n=1 Tax=Rhizobium aquaticum TaxID=1549636 RepID=A0ABV2IYP1_9HYPH